MSLDRLIEKIVNTGNPTVVGLDPTLDYIPSFIKKECYEKYGLFNLDFRLSADFELMLRFLEKEKIRSVYIDDVFIAMGSKFSNIFQYHGWSVENLCRYFNHYSCIF